MKFAARYDWRLLALMLLIGSVSSTVRGQNLAGNPGFENGPANPSPWSLVGIAHVSDGANAHTGLYEAQFSGDSSDLGDVSQSIDTLIGQQYLVTFWATSDGFGNGADFGDFLNASFGGGSLDLSDIGQLDGSDRAPYVEYSFEGIASSTSTLLDFSGQDYWGNMWLDDVSVTAVSPPPVPEPASILLLGLSIFPLFLFIRRRPQRTNRLATNGSFIATVQQG